ncbi:hypothetical protein [Microbulbifer yueqingensis]|uniref:Uncharacterized protein n=1 Tax=Microbulbifer yueqingensis TaxID=658219 RepID=A0A1G9ADD0_9GAMM|nr:hypothetical protein [Microbulbifer yueqingensis]SDK25253.1 hypothetical protein SAMN05216212_1957 [Microbulbifer yueqingensis]
MKRAFQAILPAFALFTVPASAGTWTPPVDIEVAYAHSGHGGYGIFQISDASVNADCDPTWYVVSKLDNPAFSEIYALMLAAYTSGKQVRLWVEGCSPHTSDGYPLIQHVKTVPQ